MAMTIGNDTNIAYEQAAARTDVSRQIRTLRQRNLGDERRHWASIEERLAQM
jgi:hypothetical protein